LGILILSNAGGGGGGGGGSSPSGPVLVKLINPQLTVLNYRTILTDKIAERQTRPLTIQVVDQNGNPLTADQIATLTLTLYDAATGTVINGRNKQNVLNANGCVIDVLSGMLNWTMDTLDNIAIGTATFEKHKALFEWTWNKPDGGTGYGKYELVFTVENLQMVP